MNMNSKKTSIILLLIFSLIFSVLFVHKIDAITSKIPQAPGVKEKQTSEVSPTKLDSSVENIQKIIGENTPNFIAEPIIVAVLTTEDFRINTGTTFENKKNEIQTEINTFNDPRVGKKEGTSIFLKIFKYLELYFFHLLELIFKNAIAFYFILITAIFLVLRYFWNKIF